MIGEFIRILHTLNKSERFSSQNSYITYTDGDCVVGEFIRILHTLRNIYMSERFLRAQF